MSTENEGAASPVSLKFSDVAAIYRQYHCRSIDHAQTVGLGKDALQRRARIGSDKTQRRLRELVEVLNKVEPRFGSELMAYAWYRSEPLPGFDGRTAMQLVQEGKAQQVLEYIDAVDEMGATQGHSIAP